MPHDTSSFPPPRLCSGRSLPREGPTALESGTRQAYDGGRRDSARRRDMTTFVYDFVDGHKDLKDLLGGKGANLAEMTRMGLPVPPGFTITTEACRAYLRTGAVPDGLFDEVEEHLRRIQEQTGKRLGDLRDPLLLSVRSGGKFSMPGMMETILDIGLTDSSVLGLAEQSG